MALRDWVRNSGNEALTVARIATVAVASPGKQEKTEAVDTPNIQAKVEKEIPTVARIAKVAVANLGKQEPEPTNGRDNRNSRNSRNNRGSGSCKLMNEIYSIYTDSATDSGTSATATLATSATVGESPAPEPEAVTRPTNYFSTSATATLATLAILATAPANRIEVDPWLAPCCICGGIEFTGAIFTDVESFWCVACQVVPDGWIKRRRVNSPKKAMRKQAKRRSLPDARCKVCGKESYGSIDGGRFCKACGAPCDESEPAIAPARAVVTPDLEPFPPATVSPEPLPTRQWKPGHLFTCTCGESTGWATDGVGLCPSCKYGPDDPLEPPPTIRPKKAQVSCRAFSVTGIHAITRAELCRESQGEHCGKCELRQTIAT